MKILLTAIFFLQSAWAQSPTKTYLKADEIIYNPGKFKPGRYVISYKDFEDVRLDSNLDGKIDFWYLKKGSTEIYTHFTDGNPVRWEVRTGKRMITEASYVMSDGRWLLETAQVRAPLLMNLQDEGCEVTAIKKKITSLGEELNARALAVGIEEHLIDRECADKLSEEFLGTLVNSLRNNLSSSNRLVGCMNTNEFKAAFSKDKIPVAADLFAAKFELQVSQLGKQPKNYGPLIKCEKAKDQKEPLSTDESTGFIHLDTTAISDANSKAIKHSNALLSPSSISHELLHRSGLKKEEDVEAIEQFCKNHPDGYPKLTAKDTHPAMVTRTLKKNTQDGIENTVKTESANLTESNFKSTRSPAATSKEIVAHSGSNSKGVGSSATIASAREGSQLAANAATANVPVELTVAQTQVPPTSTLSESITNPAPATEAGSQQALVRSASESSGMLRMANNLAGAMNTKALAATEADGGDAGRGSSEVSRGVASTKSTSIKSLSSNPGADLLKASTRSMASDERVVEQITLDGSTSAPAPSAGPGARNVANSTAPSAPSASRAPANDTSSSGGSEVAGGGAASFSGGGGSYGGSGAGASLGSTPSQSPVRGPAATRPNEGSPEPTNKAKSETAKVTAARDEVITFISNSNYAQAKKKLSDPAFGKQLESQKITILDLYGNSLGATKGEVIFLDQGDRFVRQK